MPGETDENVNMITELDLDVCLGQQAMLPLWHVIFYMCKRVVRSTIPKPCRFCSKDFFAKARQSGQESQLLCTFEYGDLVTGHVSKAFIVQEINYRKQ